MCVGISVCLLTIRIKITLAAVPFQTKIHIHLMKTNQCCLKESVLSRLSLKITNNYGQLCKTHTSSSTKLNLAMTMSRCTPSLELSLKHYHSIQHWMHMMEEVHSSSCIFLTVSSDRCWCLQWKSNRDWWEQLNKHQASKTSKRYIKPKSALAREHTERFTVQCIKQPKKK